MKAEEIIKALEERIHKKRNCEYLPPYNGEYDDVYIRLEGCIDGLELAIKIVNNLNK